MLTVIRSKGGFLHAVCEWWLVDGKGAFDLKGEYVFVDQLEVGPNADGRECIRQIIQQIAVQVPWAKYAYWERREKARRLPRLYSRTQLVKHWGEVRV